MLESPIVKEQYVIGSDTVFDFGVRIFDSADVSCYVYDPDTKTETQLYKGTDFSVGLKPGTTDYSNGARITLLTPQPATGKLTIIRSVVPLQAVSLPNFGKIPSESLEMQLDRTEAAVQQLTEVVQLAYKIPFGQSGTVSPEDSIRGIVEEMGGGGSGGGSMSYADSAGHATKAAGLDNGVVVASATNADSAGHATKAAGLDNGVVVASATNADSAGHADALNDPERSGIINEAVQSAGATAYDGPFALNTYGSGSAMTAGIKSGYVYAGGSQYLISAFDNDSVLFGEGSTLYLTLLSSGGAITSGLVTSPSGATSDTVVVRIASRGLDSEKTEQIQFGDIVTVPWGLGGGAANVGIVSKTWNTSHTAEADGLIMANAVMTPGTAVGGAGSYAAVTVGTTTYKFAETPQSGINTGSYGCSIQVPVTSGQIWSATSLNNTSDCKLYFLKFTSNGN